jgi:anaerobic magnesium-protoporphyrin IX monomethyl ester cyclase
MKPFKILLIYPNEPMLGVAPGNLALLSACLKKEGFDVKLFDCTIYNQGKETNDDIRIKLGHVIKTNIEELFLVKKEDIHDDFVRIVEEYKPDLIGITLIDSTIRFGLSFIERIKDKKIPVITGGIGSTLNYKKILDSGLVNWVCIGEGEELIVELSKALSEEKDWSTLRNLCYKDKEGNIIKNPLRKLVKLDDLPCPDFSIYEYFRFYRPYMEKVVRMLSVDLDRGCPHGCTYCGSPTLRKTYTQNKCGVYYRVKSFDKFFEETKYLIKAHDINFLYIMSETFLTLSLDKLKIFAERYKKEIGLPFHCQSRLDTFTEEKTKLLDDMGCSSLAVGLEHGSEKIRYEILNKRLTDKQIIDSFKILSKYNIIVTINNMIGFPDETRENVFETINLNRKVLKNFKARKTINVFTFVPFMGTDLREVCIQKGYIDPNEEIPFHFLKYSMLDMPSMSKEEIHGLERTVAFYIQLPKSYWPKIKIAEKTDEEGEKMFNELSKLIKI